MDRLFPFPASDIDVYDAYRPRDPRASLVRLNMVVSLDGHVRDQHGVSGGLGGEGDEEAFFAMRAMADAIVAGAGTVRAEGYGPMRIRPTWKERRAGDGLTAPAPVVVVTRSLDLDLDSPLFSEAVTPTIVLTTADPPAQRVNAVEDAGAVVVAIGEGAVDLAASFQRLADALGLRHLLVEGGPALNAQLFAAGLVDELCVTLGPTVVGSADAYRLAQDLADPVDLRLAMVLRDDDELLLTYRRA